MTDGTQRTDHHHDSEPGGDLANDALESAQRATDRALLAAVHSRLPAPEAFAPPTSPHHRDQTTTAPDTSRGAGSKVWQHIASGSYGNVNPIVAILQRQLTLLRDDAPAAAADVDRAAAVLNRLRESLELRAVTRPDALADCAYVQLLLGALRTGRDTPCAGTNRRLTTCLHLTRELTRSITRLFDATHHLASTDGH
ncbi:hypothetical protein [Streptomyces sp. ISL-100]|uniref:hypothetical protein n=1 Tax=Streptomyces sp. ISL-100 TaxID=2819173 RepID=UPI001BE7D2F9|nr:hypothetical protein [Streptomyces sp. ISL-100]MBT2400872.1 hypothetical protein [Streptomyces sp. ISL-100]